MIRSSRKKKALVLLSVLLFFCGILYYFNATVNILKEDTEFIFPESLEEEKSFPLAYGISLYKDGGQFLQLMSLIYRPFNLYCVHVDKKSDAHLQKLVHNLTRQYPNIIVPEKFIEVHHSQFSVLESELLCMEALYRHTAVAWKYFINLTGQELPLKTNLEIIRIFKQLKGANLMEKIKVNSWRVPKSIGEPPHGVKLWKGAVHIIATREYVKFALFDPRALDVLQYLRKTGVPDETYFSTLNHDHGMRAPGGYSGNLTRDPIHYPFLNRHKIWYSEGVCHGKFLRGICIFAMKDIPEMISNQNMKFFANKFVVGMNDNVSQFMVEWFRNRTRTVYSQPNEDPFINLTYYSQLAVVNNHF